MGSIHNFWSILWKGNRAVFRSVINKIRIFHPITRSSRGFLAVAAVIAIADPVFWDFIESGNERRIRDLTLRIIAEFDDVADLVCLSRRLGFGREKTCPIYTGKLTDRRYAEHHDKCQRQREKRFQRILFLRFHCIPPFFILSIDGLNAKFKYNLLLTPIFLH